MSGPYNLRIQIHLDAAMTNEPPAAPLAHTSDLANIAPRDKAEILRAGFSGSEPIRGGSGTSKSGPSRSLPLMWSIGLPYQPRISHW